MQSPEDISGSLATRANMNGFGIAITFSALNYTARSVSNTSTNMPGEHAGYPPP